MKKLLLTALGGLLLLSGCAQIGQSGQLTSDEPLTHNWGDINIMGGLVSHEFELTNTGESEIILKGAPTSCMCTTAQFEFEGENYSPKFSLHSNPTDWSYALAPGEEFEVLIAFDPLAHGPDATGPVSRTVSILAEGDNDPTEIRLLGNVFSEKDYENKYGTEGYEMGDFVFYEKEFDFGIIKQSSGIVSHKFEFEYTGDQRITVTGVPTSCACTSATTDSKVLEKGDKGVVIVEFDPNLHEEPEGKFFKTINVLTEPQQEEDVELKIWAEMDLDLGPDAYKLQEEHIN
jgi:hypothetical protein